MSASPRSRRVARDVSSGLVDGVAPSHRGNNLFMFLVYAVKIQVQATNYTADYGGQPAERALHEIRGTLPGSASLRPQLHPRARLLRSGASPKPQLVGSSRVVLVGPFRAINFLCVYDGFRKRARPSRRRTLTASWPRNFS